MKCMHCTLVMVLYSTKLCYTIDRHHQHTHTYTHTNYKYVTQCAKDWVLHYIYMYCCLEDDNVYRFALARLKSESKLHLNLCTQVHNQSSSLSNRIFLGVNAFLYQSTNYKWTNSQHAMNVYLCTRNEL